MMRETTTPMIESDGLLEGDDLKKGEREFGDASGEEAAADDNEKKVKEGGA